MWGDSSLILLLFITFLWIPCFTTNSFNQPTYSTDQQYGKPNLDVNDMLNFDKRLKYIDEDSMNCKENTEDPECQALAEFRFSKNLPNEESFGKNIAFISENKDSNCKKELSFFLRYIRLFLYVTHLKDKVVSDVENNLEIVDLQFVISAEDLKYLQSVSKKEDNKNLFSELYKVDSILSKGLSVKKETLLSGLMSFISITLEEIQFNHIFKISSEKILLSILTFSVMLLLYYIKKHFRTSNVVFVLFLVNSGIILEGVLVYSSRLKEAAAEDHVYQLKNPHEPADCNPDHWTYFEYYFNWFWKDECLQYYKKLAVKETEKVSLLKCILLTYGQYFIEIPLETLANSFRIYSEKLTSCLPWLLQPIFMFFITLFLTILLAILISGYILRPRIRMCFWGFNLELDMTHKKLYHQDYDPIPFTDEPDRIQAPPQLQGAEDQPKLQEDLTKQTTTVKEEINTKDVEYVNKKMKEFIDDENRKSGYIKESEKLPIMENLSGRGCDYCKEDSS